MPRINSGWFITATLQEQVGRKGAAGGGPPPCGGPVRYVTQKGPFSLLGTVRCYGFASRTNQPAQRDRDRRREEIDSADDHKQSGRHCNQITPPATRFRRLP